MKAAGSLRLKLLVAFAFVSVPPLLVLASALLLIVNRAFDTAVARRLDQGLATTHHRLDSLEQRAASEVSSIADDLGPVSRDERAAGRLADRHHLQELELLDGDERVLSSAHWPAGFGLPDDDRTFEGAKALRLEMCAEGYGATRRMTVTSTRPAVWEGKPAVVRGGYFLDDAFWSETRDLLGLEVGIWDADRRAFETSLGSPLASWAPPAPQGEGLLPGGARHRWSSAPLARTLTLYVAARTGEWDVLAHRVRATSLAVAGASLLAAVGLALAFARRISEPAAALADAARRVAAGDLLAHATVDGDDELARLAHTFNGMTEALRTTQDRLVQVERVAAWREIARRLAHELKNPIFPIALSMQTLQRATSGVALPSPGGTDLGKLLDASIQTTLDELRRLQHVVDEFSAFARMPQPRLRPLDLNAIAREVLSLYAARAAHLRTDVQLDSALPAVLADGDLLVRAAGNLVANALDTMPEEGTLSVRTVRFEGDVALEVEDTGPGLTEEERARLFTPYFTTKPGGTGLGLAIVQGIASDHGGRVLVRPASVRGTVFALVLPIAKDVDS